MPNEVPSPGRAGNPADGQSGTSEQYRDLCSSCDNAEEHAARGRPRRPIYFCEEFEVFTAAPTARLAGADKAMPGETHGDSGRMGLCVNCENARTCTLPMPEGGIWHCEEYR